MCYHLYVCLYVGLSLSMSLSLLILICYHYKYVVVRPFLQQFTVYNEDSDQEETFGLNPEGNKQVITVDSGKGQGSAAIIDGNTVRHSVFFACCTLLK